MRFTFALVLVLATTGCGPLFVPMLPRLSPQAQQTVDQMWDNMLTPVQRVDRETLLDANLAYWMFEIGVDRMRMSSEKHFAGGTAIMEIDCDRANPDVDQYTITILDERGRSLRRERYSRAEVEESSRMLRGTANVGPEEWSAAKAEEKSNADNGPTTQPLTQPGVEPATKPQETPEQRKFRLESERRQRATAAATQPARLGIPAP